MTDWHSLTEAQKLAAVADAVDQISHEGLNVTGDRVGLRIGTTGRTGRTYLSKLLAAPAKSPQIALTEQYWAASKPSPLPLSVSAPTKPSTVTFQSIPPKPVDRTIVCMPDVQAPFHDRALVEKFTSFIGDFQPDMLAQVGDFTDSTEISVWANGLLLEYAGGLQDGLDQAEQILADIRSVYAGRMVIVRSNHDDRLHRYIAKSAPGLADLRDLTIERQLHLAEHDVEFSHKIVDLAPGWIMAHGDEGGLSGVAGQTAMKLARQCGKSVVCGHSHRAGITSETTGYNGTSTTLSGLEVGHFMDLSKATYLKRGSGNWQQAFGILRVRDGRVYPELVSVIDGHFTVDGVEY